MFNEETGEQLFPFRTLAMVLSMTSLLGVSHIAWYFNLNFKCNGSRIFHPMQVRQYQFANYASLPNRALGLGLAEGKVGLVRLG